MKYARIAAFYKFMGPFSQKVRERRMAKFAALMNLKPGARVLDLGGQPKIWSHVGVPLDITVLNLPGIAAPAPPDSIHRFHFVEGDACDAPEFEDKSFDLVFSNSVIEHVGDETRQAAFAREARRIGVNYWVQTPSIWFPIEAHTGVPFWFFLPKGVRNALIARWEEKLPGWTRMVKGTTVLSKSAMRRFFSDGELMTERKFLFPKSYVAFRRQD